MVEGKMQKDNAPTYKQLTEFIQGKRVFITGHTGFQGSWLCLWLNTLNVQLAGYALDPLRDEDHYALIFNHLSIEDHRNDIRDFNTLAKTMSDFNPDIAIHLAAQPLVRKSYDDPIETFSTNFMGTANFLKAVLQTQTVSSAVVVTTDKVYQNQEWGYSYRETDRLGGHDPYSASKASCEILAESFFKSYFKPRNIGLATVRAGNCIGGGDWSENRIIPDIVKSVEAGKDVVVRNPESTRPWQHVLDPLYAYLKIAHYVSENKADIPVLPSFNIGPSQYENHTVAELTDKFLQSYGEGSWIDAGNEKSDKIETNQLAINSEKAWNELKWKAVWNFHDAVHFTARWYAEFKENNDPHAISLKQLSKFTSRL